MYKGWTAAGLARRIDRCYLVAAWTNIAEKRGQYVAMARRYRMVLADMLLADMATTAPRARAA